MARTASSRGKTPQRNKPPSTPASGRGRLSTRNKGQMLPPSSASRPSTPSRQQAGGDRSPRPAEDVGDSARLWTRPLGPPSTPQPRRSARLNAAAGEASTSAATPVAEASTSKKKLNDDNASPASGPANGDDNQLSEELAAFQNDVLDTLREVEEHRLETESEEALWEKTMSRLHAAWPNMPDSTRDMIRHMLTGFEEDTRTPENDLEPVAGPSRQLSDLPSPDEDDDVVQNDTSSALGSMAPRKRKASGLRSDESEGSPSPKRRHVSEPPERSPRKNKGKGKARRVDVRTSSREASPVEPSSSRVTAQEALAGYSDSLRRRLQASAKAKRARSPSPAPAADNAGPSTLTPAAKRARRSESPSPPSVPGPMGVTSSSPSYAPRGRQHQFVQQHEGPPSRQPTRLLPPTALHPQLRAQFTDEQYEEYRAKQRKMDQDTIALYGLDAFAAGRVPRREAAFMLVQTSSDPKLNPAAANKAQPSAAGPSGPARSQSAGPSLLSSSPIPSNLPSSPATSHSVPAPTTPPPVVSPAPSSQSLGPASASPAVPPAPTASSAQPAPEPMASMLQERSYGTERYLELVDEFSPVPPSSPAANGKRPLQREDAKWLDSDLREFYYREIPHDAARDQFGRGKNESWDIQLKKMAAARHRDHADVALELTQLQQYEDTRDIMDDPALVVERAVPRAGNLRMRHPHVSPLEAAPVYASTERRTYWDTTDWAAERNRVFFVERVRHAISHELHEAQKTAFVEEGRDPAEAPLPTQEHVTAEVASYLDERVTAIRDAAGAFPPSDEALRAAQRYGWRWTREDFDRILPEDESANGVLHSDGRKKKNYSPRFVPAYEGTAHLCKPF